MSQGAGFENILNSAEQLLWDTDRFKQRAGAEMLAGVTRGIATLALIKLSWLSYCHYRCEELAKATLRPAMVLDNFAFRPPIHNH